MKKIVLEKKKSGWVARDTDSSTSVTGPSPIKAIKKLSDRLSGRKSRFSGFLSLRVPPELHEMASDCASEVGVSLNQFIVNSLEKAVKRGN